MASKAPKKTSTSQPRFEPTSKTAITVGYVALGIIVAGFVALAISAFRATQ